MTTNLVTRLRKRAEIRRQIATRKSVQEGQPDRIADILEEAAAELDRVTAERNILLDCRPVRERDAALARAEKAEAELHDEKGAHASLLSRHRSLQGEWQASLAQVKVLREALKKLRNEATAFLSVSDDPGSTNRAVLALRISEVFGILCKQHEVGGDPIRREIRREHREDETCTNCGVDVDKEPTVLCDECEGSERIRDLETQVKQLREAIQKLIPFLPVNSSRHGASKGTEHASAVVGLVDALAATEPKP